MHSTTTLLIGGLLKHTVLNIYCRTYSTNFYTRLTVLNCGSESNMRNVVDLLVMNGYRWAGKISRSRRGLLSVLAWTVARACGFNRLKGRAMAQAVSRRPVTAEAPVGPCGIYGGQSGTGTGFSPNISVFLCKFHFPCAPLQGKMKKKTNHLHHRVAQ
jgi:hypothetical protein